MIDDESAARRRHADDRAPAGFEARTNQQLDLVLVVLQRARRRTVAEREIVPGPARTPARLLERVIVANQVAGDGADAFGGKLLAPFVEDRPSLRVSWVDRRIAVGD